MPSHKRRLGVLQDAAFSAVALEEILFCGLAAVGHVKERSEIQDLEVPTAKVSLDLLIE